MLRRVCIGACRRVGRRECGVRIWGTVKNGIVSCRFLLSLVSGKLPCVSLSGAVVELAGFGSYGLEHYCKLLCRYAILEIYGKP